MTTPLGKSYNFVALGNPTQQVGGVGNPLLSLPVEVLDTITGCVATGKTEQEAATHATRWGQVCASTYLMTQEPRIERAINNHARHLDEALIILWNHIVAQFFRQGLNPPQLTTAREMRCLMRDPTNASLLDTIESIDLDNCGLKVIPPEINTLRYLHTLNLRDNQIAQIDPGAFADSLRYLCLEHNQIAQVGPGAFADSLRRLHLENNRIAQVGPETFAGCLSLQHLHLKNNQIAQIAPGAFAGCLSLRHLGLENNQIAQVGPETFAGCTELRDLALGNNQIAQIAPGAFAGCGTLERLYLRCNRITQIGPETFAGCGTLQQLYLWGNQIAQIAPQAFAGCRTLDTLFLCHNQIVQIAPETFAGCLSLAQLQLGGNPVLYTTPSDDRDYLKEFNAFSRYVCRSEFAAFYKAVSEGRLSIPEIVEHVKQLADRNLIYEMVYFEAVATAKKGKRVFSDDGDPQWGEHHVCDDMPIFYRALRMSINEKSDRLSAEQMQAVLARLDEMAREEGDLGPAADNILRCIDAMTSV